MNAIITQHLKADGTLSVARAEISGIDLNDPLCEQKIGIYHRIYSRHAAEITKETNKAFAKLEQDNKESEAQEEQHGKLALNLSCDWLDDPIRTGIFNPTTGKEYILSGYYQDATGNKHFTQQEAIEIGERIPGWQLCTDEFHKALAKVVFDDKKWEWKENVCGTNLNGFEYLTKVLKYELGGHRGYGEGALWNVGNLGYSWSSSVSNTNGLYLGFSATWLITGNTNYRAFGFQVRCLQE